jgi:hypothetical protein
MSWITLTPDSVLSVLSAPERQGITTAALAEGQTADGLLAVQITETIDEVRGYVAACAGNKLGPAGTIPPRLRSVTLFLLRYRIFSRVPGLDSLLGKSREEEWKNAQTLLRDVAACRFAVEDPQGDATSGTQANRRPVNRLRNRLAWLANVLQNNCGTDEGGFQPGNDCGKGDGSSTNDFTEIDTPSRVEKDDFYKRTAKGEKVKDASGDTVNFGKRLQGKFDSLKVSPEKRAEYDRRKAYLEYAMVAVRKGKKHTIGDTTYYGHKFGTGKKGFMVLVDARDGEVWDYFATKDKYMAQYGVANSRKRSRQDEWPSPALLFLEATFDQDQNRHHKNTAQRILQELFPDLAKEVA